jgi:hypothetical protein
MQQHEGSSRIFLTRDFINISGGVLARVVKRFLSS